MNTLVFRIVSLAVLAVLATTVLLTPLGSGGVSGAEATFCLGFLLLFGYYAGKLLEGIGLPSISSYIIVGVVCGPFFWNLLNTGVVSRLQVFDDIALAVIALIAGGEMRMATLRARAGTFARVIGLQCLFSFALVIGVTFLLAPVMPFLDGSFRLSLAVGLLLSLIVVALSPSATIGVITDLRARGPMTEIIVGVTVILDVVVLVLAAIVVPFARMLADNVALSLDFAAELGVAVGGSIVAGVLFGAVVVLYIRWVGAYLPLFLIGIGLIGSEICHYYHFEPLLAFMIAGFLIENFSKVGHQLITGLERSAVPVYIVFFVISGASIDVSALQANWLLALCLVVARGAAFWAGTAAASAVDAAVRPYRNTMWLGFLSQAGVAIGIASLVQRNFEWGNDLKSIALAVIALNQFFGPIALKGVLQRAQEVGKS